MVGVEGDREVCLPAIPHVIRTTGLGSASERRSLALILSGIIWLILSVYDTKSRGTVIWCLNVKGSF
jgi:hypothetical protein